MTDDEVDEMYDVPSLEELARGKGPFGVRKLKLLRKWISADWESQDIDRDAVKTIDRLLRTLGY